jgi:Fe-S-cluster containining protein
MVVVLVSEYWGSRFRHPPPRAETTSIVRSTSVRVGAPLGMRLLQGGMFHRTLISRLVIAHLKITSRPKKKKKKKEEMDEVMLKVARAIERGATTMKGVVDATGLSRLKVERALHALEKQKLLFRDSQGLRAPGQPTTSRARGCGSCNLCCDILEVTAVAKPVNELCRHWAVGTGCTIYNQRPQMCQSFSCAWLQGHLGDEWYPETAGIVVHFSEGAVNVQVDPACADRWKEEPYFSKLCEWSLNGITMNGGRAYATLVIVGSDKFLLLGRTVVPDPTLFGTAFLPVSRDTFRYWKATSQEHLQRLNARVAEIRRVREEFGYCAIPDDDDPYPPYRPALLRMSKHPQPGSA